MTRIHGLDMARALAVIGMMIAHIGPSDIATDGYPSVLFAVLSGVSMGIISSRAITPARLRDARVNLLVRGILLVGTGVVLAALQTGIVVVLIAIGASYLLLTPVVHWGTRWLGLLLAVLVVLGLLLAGAQEVLQIAWGSQEFADLLFGVYPLFAWLVYTLVGLLTHRLALDSSPAQILMLVLGLLLLVVALFTVALIPLQFEAYEEPSFWGAALRAEPHTGGLLDMLGSAGVALAVIAVCLWACRLPAVVAVAYPLRAMGSMSFTVYVFHVIITTLANGTFVAVIDGSPEFTYPWWKDDLSQSGVSGADYGWTMYPPEVYSAPLWPQLFFWQLIGFLFFAAVWKWKLRRGPIEWCVHRAVQAALGEPVRSAHPTPLMDGVENPEVVQK